MARGNLFVVLGIILAICSAMVVLYVVPFYGQDFSWNNFIFYYFKSGMISRQVQFWAILVMFILTGLSSGRLIENFEVIQKEREKYENLISEANDAIIIVDTKTDEIIEVNNKTCQSTKYDRDEIIGMKLWGMHPHWEQELVAETYQKVLKEGEARLDKVNYKRKDGTIFPVSTGLKKITYGKKAVIQIIARDITDIEEAERKLEREKIFTNAVITSLLDGLVFIDNNNKIVLINPPIEKIFNIKKAELENKFLTDDFKDSGAKKFLEVVSYTPQTPKESLEKGFVNEVTLLSPERMTFQVITTPVVDSQHVPLGYMKVFHDVTRAREIDRLKSEFISVASHQLRTPLSSVKWTLKMMLDGDMGKLTEEQIEFLSRSYETNERMIHLVNDLLNVSRIEEGRMELKTEWVQIEDLIEKVKNEIQGEITDRKIKFILKTPQKVPKVFIDPTKIYLVIQNLLDNAVRYTLPGGQVTISIDYDKIKMKVSVSDSGVGIPKEEQMRVFSRFFRAENVVRLQTEGTGLGLFIVRNIVEKHGGQVGFKSKEGKGSTFYFTLPLKK